MRARWAARRKDGMKLAFILLCLSRMPVDSPRAFMIWGDRDCLIEIKPLPETRLEAPLKDDGTPDMSRARITPLPVTYTSKCGRIEIRH